MPFTPHSWGLVAPHSWVFIIPHSWGIIAPLIWGLINTLIWVSVNTLVRVSLRGHIDPFAPMVGTAKVEQAKTYYMKELIGQVTPEEKQEIQALFERRNGLNELAKIVTADNAELYEKLVRDLGETGTKFQRWWDAMGEKYHWRGAEGGNWEINFDTNEIYLVTP